MYVPFHMDRKAIGRIKLLLLMAVFLAPLTAAYTVFSQGWYSNTTVNYGDLIQPGRSMSGVVLRGAAGQPVAFGVSPRKWTMLYVSSAPCTKLCKAALYRMRQVHLAQGRQANRVRRVFIAAGGAVSADLQSWSSDYPDMQIVIAATDISDVWVRQYGLLSDRIYLVDPLGNLVMSYPPESNPSGMRKDLSRLLRASQIG